MISDTIAQFAQELSDNQFFINDLSFIFEMSRKRAVSPYAIIVALIYLKRLKNKCASSSSPSLCHANSTANNSNESSASASSSSSSSFSANTSKLLTQQMFSNTELCLISIVSPSFILKMHIHTIIFILRIFFFQLVASKYLTDEGESNEIYNNDWAEVCDIPIKRINQLERSFLNQMESKHYRKIQIHIPTSKKVSNL